MRGIDQAASFQQDGAEQVDLRDLAGHAIVLNPVPHADAVLAHQHELAEEGHDEVL